MPRLPATGTLSRTGCAGQAAVVSGMGLLGKAGSGIWRPAGGAFDSGAGAGGAWRQSHRANVTGDRSGDFLYKALFRAGFANQPTSTNRDDGLALKNAYMAATLRCAPPANKPLPTEMANCRHFLERELEILQPRAVLVLGSIAMRAYLGLLKERGQIATLAAFPFRHGASYELAGDLPRLFASYHPSQQNTFTGKLTDAMMLKVLRDVRNFLTR